MVLSPQSMYDTFKDDICRELGPLDPDWFDILTAQAVTTERNDSDQDDLCANQEGNFKTPFDKSAVESQLFSTPKVFRHRRVVSPETEDEQSFTAEPESPYSFRISKEGVPGSKYGGIQPQTQDIFDLLHTPQKFQVDYTKHIPESLGAHIHSDISWTSSLNTPPALPSTLILSKTDESPCPVSLSEDKSVVFVRTLFPSLSNASRVGTVSPKSNNLPTIQEGADTPEAGQNPVSHNSPSQSSLNQSDVWRQKLPDAIEDGEIRSTVASVLDGAENVLSIFFSNSSSALRKVRTDRIKRKQIISAKEHGCSSTHFSTKNMAVSSEQRAADQQPCRVPSPPHLKSPMKTGDMGYTQWSPLSLSEIPPSTVDTSCLNTNPAAQVENNCLTEQLQSDSDSSQLVRPSSKISYSGFIKKKRQFVYTVQTSKPQVQERESHSQKIDSSAVQELNVKHLPNAQDESDCCNISNKTFDGKDEMRQRENVTEENLPPSVQAKVQDVDMSQLSRAFAQDFSQMSDSVKLSEAAEDTPQNDFSPSACLSALKQAKHKARQASLHHDCDGVTNRRHVSATNQNNFINERAICDSGFQSAVANITHMTALSALPSSEKEGQTQQWTTPFQSTNKENRKVHLKDVHGAETDAKLSFVDKENQTLDPGRESEVQTKTTLTHPSSSAKGAVDNINCIPLNGQVHGSLPEKTIVSLPSVHASGFKTASNKSVISSANLERAKRLFEETEGERLSDQPTKRGHDTKDEINMSHGSVKTTTSDSNHPPSSNEKFRGINCQLTASEKAYVTELCTLLEDADKQFELTQLKTATLNQQCQDNATSPQKADKELDPDFLTGIDFDDSFSADAEKHVAITMMPGKMALVSDKTNPETSNVTSKSTEMSFSGGMKKENFSTGNVPSGMRDEDATKSFENRKMDTATCQSGFQMASGKRISISAKAMQEANAVFKDCDVVDSNDSISVKHKNSIQTLPGSVNHKENLSKFKSVHGIKVNFSEEPVKSEFENVNSDLESHGFGFKNTLALTKSASFHGNQFSTAKPFSSPLCTTSKNIGSSAIDDLSDGGFCTARVKKVCVSANAMTKAECLLNEIQTHEDTDQQIKQKENSSRTGHLTKQSSGFRTASGKGVAISSEALKKVKYLLREYDGVEDIVSVNSKYSKIPVHDPPPRNSGFLAASVKPVAFCTASWKKLSVSDDAMTKAKSLLNESATFEDTNKQLKQKEDKPQNGGFQTASGKGVAISSAALKKAKSMLSECDDVADKTSAEPTHSKMPFPGPLSRNSGFQKARGKGVAISSAALKKAKSLLSECDDVADKTSAEPTYSKMLFPGPLSRNSGFLASSGKPVAFSSESLQKAKALFDDISLNTDIPAVSDTWKSDKKHEDARNNKEKIHCGFTNAGGAKVQVSQKNLLKAKNRLREFDDDSVSVKDGGECPDSSSYSTSPVDTHKSDLSKDVKRSSNSNLATTSDKDMPAEESAPQVNSHLSSRDTDSENIILRNSSVHGCNFLKEKELTDAFKYKEDKFAPSGVRSLHREKRPNMLDCEINQTSSSEKLEFTRTEESSVLNFQSLYLSGCTETQQKFLAQEALDCTKALLEDEGLAGQSFSMTFENMPLQDNPKSSNRSVEEQKTTGKRLAEDADMTGQPPLKRQLLDEIDRILDRPRGATLQPVKSCPTAVMKDRRVFKYSISLHSNITRPHRDGKNYMETRLQKATQHSAPGDSRSTHSKIPAFAPPFFKKTETQKNIMVTDNRRTPSAFLPPFKKQRTIVQESCSKPHKEEDKHHQLSVMPSNSNTYVPPTKKTSRQSTTDVTGNKSREDIQMVALADNTKDDLVKNPKIPVGCGTEDSAAEAPEIQTLQNRELARDMQDMRIRKKKRQTIRPLPGNLFLTKTSGVSKIPLKDAVNGKPPANYTQKQLYRYGVHQHVSEITSETAESFRFSLQQFLKQEVFIDEGGVQLADGGWLIPSKNGTAGKEEFYRALCDTPGVDPKLISEGWVYNHYRWIVWKQASMERSFPATMGSLCLTPEQVLLQLKYRYDVEVDHSRRPALRKIMEKDDTAAKTLVLCVCGVVTRGHSPTRQSHNDAKTPQGANAKVENPCAVVWLTDGWYAIKAQLDDPLTAMLHKGRLAVGGKLIIHGAQLVGSQDAYSPLEAPESLMLKICANSSRPARWDTKLGFYRDPRPFLLPLSCLYSNGGPVRCVDMVILRSYPLQWMERKPDEGIVFRSVRAEEKEARCYNSRKQKAMEIVFAKIQAEFEKEEKGNKPQHRRRTISRQDIASLQDGEELYEAVGDDPTYLEAHLSEQQLETLHTYRCSLMEKKQSELQDRYRRALENAEDKEGSCPKRDITPVWRLCIADSMNQSGSVYQLNMWRPSSDLQSLLKEGCRYKVYNLTTSDGKKRSGIETVQLTGTKKTQFQDLQASQEWLSACFQPRVSATFVDLQNPEFQPLCGEVDLTGYVIAIIDGQGSSPAFYLVDGKLNFVKVRCFSSLAQSGLEDVVKPRVLLALSNLQLRGQSISPTPVVYAGDLTIFSTNPKETHLQESLSQLRNLVQSQENFFLTAEEKLSYLVKSVGMSSVSSPALQPRTPAVLQQTTTDRRQDTKTSVTSQQPIRSHGFFTPVSRCPPPASQLSSLCVNKTFNPPRRSGTPSTLKTVQTPACKPVVSPVEDEWVNDEELAMIDTQALRDW